MTGRARRVGELSRRLSIDPDDLGPAAAAPARVAPADPAEWTSSLDDPAIVAGRNGYRSFYVDDAVFARFRAAIFWLSRNPEAQAVPENMSVAITAYMRDTAAELEQRHHDGQPFPPTPEQLRSARRRRGIPGT